MQTTFHVRRLVRLAFAMAALWMAIPVARAGISTFTNRVPVLLATWFNGQGVERFEFAYTLDWAGYLNAHPGSDGQRIWHWNLAGNWDPAGIPGPTDDAVVDPGLTVRLGAFDSLYAGVISGAAEVASLTAPEARVEVNGRLRVGHSSIGDLAVSSIVDVGLHPGGLETSGTSWIARLSSSTATFGGVGGTTILRAWGVGAELLVRDRHRLQLASGFPLEAPRVMLEPGTVLENQGEITLSNALFMLLGTARPDTLPRLDNLGSISGGGVVDGIRFNNAGIVSVPDGQALNIGLGGTHAGRFQLGLGSTLRIEGMTGPSSVFEPTSMLSGPGIVRVVRGDHIVRGPWECGSLDSTAGEVRFERLPEIGRLLLRGNNQTRVAFSSGVGAGSVAEAVVDQGGALVFEAGRMNLGDLRLERGAVEVQGAQAVAGTFEWRDGVLRGGGALELARDARLLPGVRILDADVLQRADLAWQGGQFSQWSGNWTVQGGEFAIAGDFGVPGGDGALSLAGGSLVKSAGGGRSELAIGVRATGDSLIEAREGTLALRGGNQLAGGTTRLVAAPGARIELGGATVLGPGLATQGTIDIVGGSLAMQGGLSFQGGANGRFTPDSIQVQAGASLTLPGRLALSGDLVNEGSVSLGGELDVGGNLLQAGTLTRPAGANIQVRGMFENRSPLRMEDGKLWVFDGALSLHAPLTMKGSATGLAGGSVASLTNRSGLTLDTAFFSAWTAAVNSGSILVGKGAEFFHTGPFRNEAQGMVINQATWRGGGLSLLTDSRFENSGWISMGGPSRLEPGSQITGSGFFELTDGSMQIDAGALLKTSSEYRQMAGLTRVNGVLEAASVIIQDGVLRGTGEVRGEVSLGPTARWEPGNSIGTQAVAGNVNWGGVLEIEVDGPAQHDRVVVGGTLSAYDGARLHLRVNEGAALAEGDEIRWLQGPATGLEQVLVSVVGTGPAAWTARLDPLSGRLRLVDATAVPLDPSADQVPRTTSAYNDRTPADPLRLPRLHVAGSFGNREGAEALVDATLVSGEGRVLQAGTFLGTGMLTNQGNWRGMGRSTTWIQAMVNEGRFEDDGALAIGLLDNRVGGVLVARGSFSGACEDWRNEGLMRIEGIAEHLCQGWSSFLNVGTLEVAPVGSLRVQRFQQVLGPVAVPVLRVDGRMAVKEVATLGQGVQGFGVLDADVNLQGASVAPGRAYERVPEGGGAGMESIGTLTIEGHVSASGGALLELEVGNDGAHDRLVVDGALDWGDVRVRILFRASQPPAPGTVLGLVRTTTTLGAPCADCWSIATLGEDGEWIDWGQASPWPGMSVRFSNGTLSVASVSPQTTVDTTAPAGLVGATFGNVVVDEVARTITAELPASGDQGYLTISPARVIRSIQRTGNKLVMTY